MTAPINQAAFAAARSDWTADTRVQRMLATFKNHPPRYATIPGHARWTRDDECYAGYRYEALQRHWNSIAQPLLAEFDATGDDTALVNFLAQPSVDQAITAACNAAVLETLHDEIEAAARPYRCLLDAAIEEARS